MKKCLETLVDFWGRLAAFPVKIGRKYNNCGQLTEKMMISICKNVEKSSPVYVSHYLRDRCVYKPNSCPKVINGDSITVILQGPIEYRDDFTLQTAQGYIDAGYFDIIVSTWDSEKEDVLSDLRKIGAKVVTSLLPADGGYGNINFQLVSTQRGIKEAIDSGAKYICKSRTDQRIENIFIFKAMQSLFDTYPVSEASMLSERIIALSTEYGSFYEPYYVSDFLYFGLAQDMAKFLDIKLDNRECFERKGLSRKDVAEKKAIAEVYIMRSLVEILGNAYGCSIRDYWKFIKENLILLDKSIIKLYWPKYDTRYCEHLRNGAYSCVMASEAYRDANLDFTSWLLLYNGFLIYDEEYEKLLELPL